MGAEPGRESIKKPYRNPGRGRGVETKKILHCKVLRYRGRGKTLSIIFSFAMFDVAQGKVKLKVARRDATKLRPKIKI